MGQHISRMHSPIRMKKNTLKKIPQVKMSDTGWRRPTGCPIFIGHFPQKSPIISGSLVKHELQRKASCGSWAPCTQSHDEWYSDDEHTWGAGVETQKKNLVPLFKKDKNKQNLIRPGRRRLLQHYWYKVPVLYMFTTIWCPRRNGN